MLYKYKKGFNIKKTIILFLFLCFSLSNFLNAKTVQFVGTVISNGQKMIGTRYMGYVSKVYVDIGDRVEREDDLYEIESSEFDLIKIQTELMIDQSKLVVEYWKNRVHRLDKKRKRVQKNKFGDFAFEMDDLESQSDNALVMLEAAKIAIKNAVEKGKEITSVFNFLKMKAPSDGVVVERNIKVGDMVMPGMLAILIVDTEDLYVDISIAESLLKYFYVGKIAKIKLRSLDRTLSGKVKFIVPSSNFVTHKIKVRIAITEKHPRILPGMYSEVFMEIPLKKKVKKVKVIETEGNETKKKEINDKK